MRSVLIVHGDTHILTALTEMLHVVLEELHLVPTEILIATSLGEAERKAFEHRPALILFDNGLVASTGYKQVPLLDLKTAVKILLAKNSVNKKGGMKVKGQCIDSVLAKPVEREQLKEAVRRHLSRSKLKSMD